MYSWEMKSLKVFLALASALALSPPVRADFGDADFPESIFNNGPKSYHDAWCREIKKECRVRFQGSAMWVEGQGGIQSNQYLGYRYDADGDETYNYVRYRSRNGKPKQALFLFCQFKGAEGVHPCSIALEEASSSSNDYRLPQAKAKTLKER